MATGMVTVHAEAVVEHYVSERAAAVLEREGMTVDQAMSKMLTMIATDGALPFDEVVDSEHDAWFRAQVQEALADTSPGIPHEVVMEEWAKQRAELLQKASVDTPLPEGSFDVSGEADPEYDAWFLAKVDESLNDPRPAISREELDRRMAGRRAEALARLG